MPFHGCVVNGVFVGNGFEFPLAEFISEKSALHVTLANLPRTVTQSLKDWVSGTSGPKLKLKVQ